MKRWLGGAVKGFSEDSVTQLTAEYLREQLAWVEMPVKSLANNLMISFRSKTGNRMGQNQLFLARRHEAGISRFNSD